jgi:glutaryl-CoA dehydrogenase
MTEKEDILLFDQQLSDEERLIQSTVYEYCQKELMPRILQDNRDENFFYDMYKQLGELGLLGATIKGYGCAGINYVAYGLITRELERVDTSYRSGFSVQSSLSMYAIYKFGSDAQKDNFFA